MRRPRVGGTFRVKREGRRKSMPNNNVELVIGGARSGKSRFAEARFSDLAEKLYLATAHAGDTEMAARIEAHRARRGTGWRTLEERLALSEALRENAGTPVLVDCLTLWLSNLMLADRDVDQETEALVKALTKMRARCVLVSNEVGMGLVPDTELGRDFRDHQGRLNQAVAEAAGRVTFVAAGLPLTLKEPK